MTTVSDSINNITLKNKEKVKMNRNIFKKVSEKKAFDSGLSEVIHITQDIIRPKNMDGNIRRVSMLSPDQHKVNTFQTQEEQDAYEYAFHFGQSLIINILEHYKNM